MTVKRRTIFIGDWCCIAMGEFPKLFPLDVVYVNQFPRYNPFKRSIPFLGNLQPDTVHIDLPELNIYGNETGESIRLVFVDNFGNKNVDVASKIPALITTQRKLTNLEQDFDNLSLKYLELLKSFSYKSEDVLNNEMLRSLNVSKEAKKRIYSMMDYRGKQT